MAKRGMARTAQEVFEKYGKKRFNSKNAGRSLIYTYIYWGYLKNEGMSNEEILSRPLYKDLHAIREKVDSVDDAYVYNQYVHLNEWRNNLFEAAIFMRNAVKGEILHFYSILTGIIAGENLKKELDQVGDLGNVEQCGKIGLWLSMLSADSLLPTTGNYESILSLRTNIDKGLRYLNAYNTLIAIMAQEMDIPEYVLFQVETAVLEEMIEHLNEALEVIRSYVEDRGEAQGNGLRPTQEAIDATLEALRYIPEEAPPIPEENLRNTRTRIRNTVIVKGASPWENIFQELQRNYWRR